MDKHHTRHDLISHNLWSKPKTRNNQELNARPVHETNNGAEARI
jgi:hypothetical protein